MNWLRKKVSGKRNRFVDEQFNLDITYITDRIIAMSFPASGFEMMYRNSISDVARFLDDKHPRHHKIFNLSNRDYNPEKFRGEYAAYEWEDHHSPPIEMMFEIAWDMYEYLLGETLNLRWQQKRRCCALQCGQGKNRYLYCLPSLVFRTCWKLPRGDQVLRQEAIQAWARHYTALPITVCEVLWRCLPMKDHFSTWEGPQGSKSSYCSPHQR